MSKITIPDLLKRKREGKKLTMLTAYDYPFAQIVDEAGIDMILIGDSLGVVVQGNSNTLSVTMDEMLYHTRIVSRAVERAVEPVARAVAGEHPPGAIATVCRRCEPDDEQSSPRIAKSRNRARPVRMIEEPLRRLGGRGLSTAHEPRAPAAARDVRGQRLQRRHAASVSVAAAKCAHRERSRSRLRCYTPATVARDVSRPLISAACTRTRESVTR